MKIAYYPGNTGLPSKPATSVKRMQRKIQNKVIVGSLHDPFSRNSHETYFAHITKVIEIMEMLLSLS